MQQGIEGWQRLILNGRFIVAKAGFLTGPNEPMQNRVLLA